MMVSHSRPMSHKMYVSDMFFCDILVKVAVKARRVTVSGAKGTITKNLTHLPIDIRVIDMTKV